MKNLIVLTALALFSSLLQADIISLEMDQDKVATAEYRPGEEDKPLLIFIHGFLQTRDFSTVRRLADAMLENNYSVLSPTLTLGISNRAKSLACESIHLHSLDQDAVEIARWIDWAQQQGHEDIILLGHSAGSATITAYLANADSPVVRKTILISLTYFGENSPVNFETSALAGKARDMLKNGENGVAPFALSYCKQYVTTPENFLSYYDWSEQPILDAISRGQLINHIILGSSDERINPQWLAALQKTRNPVVIIDGANHFFDQEHEFDLLDAVETILLTE